MTLRGPASRPSRPEGPETDPEALPEIWRSFVVLRDLLAPVFRTFAKRGSPQGVASIFRRLFGNSLNVCETFGRGLLYGACPEHPKRCGNRPPA